MTAQFDRWNHALTTGTRVEWERGDVASGFYKQCTGRGASKPIEAIAIYRDDAGALQCIRDVYGDGSRMDADQIEDLFASCCLYPIAEEVYRAVTESGEAWPPEYGTRLTMKDQAAGVAWTPEYGRKKLGMAENERAIPGDNNPPEPTEDEPAGHKLDGEKTPDKLAFAEASAKAAEVKRWIIEIGGKPRTKPEADRLTDYGTVLKRLAKKANEDRRADKRPLEEQLKAIDERWAPAISAGETAGKWCHETSDKWVADENRRLAEEAREAEEAASKDPSAPPPEPAREIRGTGNVRTVTGRNKPVYVVTDARAYLAHLIALEGDLPAELIDAAGKIARRREVEAPGVERKVERKAA